MGLWSVVRTWRFVGVGLATASCLLPDVPIVGSLASGGSAGTTFGGSAGTTFGGNGQSGAPAQGGSPTGGIPGNEGGSQTGGSGGVAATGGEAGTGSGGVAGTEGGAGLGGSGMGGDSGSGGLSGASGATGSGGLSGASGATGSGGLSGASGATGSGGMSGAAAGGKGGNGGSGGTVTDDYVTNVSVTVHPEVATVLVVNWMQVTAVQSVWLEFWFAGGDIMTSRPQPGTLGAHQDVVLGVPASTLVTIRIVSAQGASRYASSNYSGTTDPLPNGVPDPTVLTYDEDTASPERWLLGSVEDSAGGCANTSCYFHSTFWIYIMDRQGRIVWYYADPVSNAVSSFPRVAKDGEYIWFEQRPFGGTGARGVIKMTLDWSYFQQGLVTSLSDCIDVTDDGALLYDTYGTNPELRERTSGGLERTIWSCRTEFGQAFNCYANSINYNPLDDTVLLTYAEGNTVVEIARQTGQLIATYGDHPGSYDFSPSSWGFESPHFANITPDGTLLVSSHTKGIVTATAGEHVFVEFGVNRGNQTLTAQWFYDAGPEWALYRGMAIRLPNGNTLANYGTGGVIREITPDKQTAFHVKFDVPGGMDFYNKMLGHNVLIADLYDLNGGPL